MHFRSTTYMSYFVHVCPLLYICMSCVSVFLTTSGKFLMLKPLLRVETLSWNKFHKVALHGETLVFVTTAIVATIADVESRSTFGETCLATEVHKVSRNRPCYTVQRIANAHKLQLNVSTCNSGLSLVEIHMHL